MFDYQTSKHAHFDAACRAFAIEHNLEDVAAAVGMSFDTYMDGDLIHIEKITLDIPICFCAGLRGTWSDRSPQKTVFSVCSFVNW
ncbi:TPA: hypothetical protein ACNEZ6_000159 [Escherichia coli]|nr:phage regulatory CII family protein [Escherichia coli]